ncbi:uncharacterized protein [Palaemon carinicauda]|uniref:uncharacterized protein isoform X2 n=1 Tax=Palaemon carinicauda TaxID=392227 RepID=UPI0035B61E55
MSDPVFVFLTALCIISGFPVYTQGCDYPFEAIGTQCLLVDPLEHGSFYDMRLKCKTMGAKLVKIPHASQLAEIIDYIKENGLDHNHYWIDATDDNHESHFTWSDGSNVPAGAPFWRYDCDGAFTLRPRIDGKSNCAILDSEFYFLLSDVSCLGDVGEIKYSPICEQA